MQITNGTAINSKAEAYKFVELNGKIIVDLDEILAVKLGEYPLLLFRNGSEIGVTEEDYKMLREMLCDRGQLEEGWE